MRTINQVKQIKPLPQGLSNASQIGNIALLAFGLSFIISKLNYILMIARLFKSQTLFNSIVCFTNSKPVPFKPKPAPFKTPNLKPKKGQVSIATLAEQFDLNEEVLRKQLNNPLSNFINEDQIRLLKIINMKEIKGTNAIADGMISKSPVVTIMGHVDHGKTTLIDYLRRSNIAEGEIGGITQKIGAFHIVCHNQKITFIDTPGHEAFSNMRRRGARVTDLIVLIVSSTEGVKKQTQQVINLINQDQIPTIVAINKIDLPNADVEAVEDSLFEAGLNIEPRGGNIPVVHISAKTGQNVDLLSELILQETKDLKAIVEGMAEGIVLEACQNKQGLNSMTLIVKQGILRVGSTLIIGEHSFKIKSIQDDSGSILKEGRPGDAVHIIGIPNVPSAGDFVYEVEDQKKAKYIVTKRKQVVSESLQKVHEKTAVKSSKLKLDYKQRKSMHHSATGQIWISKFNEKEQLLLEKIEQLKALDGSLSHKAQLIQEAEEELTNHKEYVYQFLINIGINKNNFNVILRFADRGIEETLLEQLQPIIARLKDKHNLTVNILKSDIGQITTNDLQDSATCNAQIFTFGTEASPQAENMLNQFEKKPRVHRLIHTFLKDFEDSAVNAKKIAIKGVEKGRAIVADIFPIKSKKGSTEVLYVPGLRVQAGKLGKTHKLYVFRNGSPATEGSFAKSIKVFKKQMTEVKKGDQCTLTADFGDFVFEKGDEIVAYEE